MPDERNQLRRPANRSRIGSGLYGQVVDAIGQDIIDGRLAEGELIFADQISERFNVSRSVVRESLRTLNSMGLLESRPQVGTRVLPFDSWDLLNPEIVKWRGLGPSYIVQMRELLELRMGIEYAAAGLVAERISPEDAADILDSVGRMEDAQRAGDTHAFFLADSDFHSGVLAGAGNPVMARFADTIGAGLHTRMRDTPAELRAQSVERHRMLAEASAAHDAESARELALSIVRTTLEEFQPTVQHNDKRSTRRA